MRTVNFPIMGMLGICVCCSLVITFAHIPGHSHSLSHFGFSSLKMGSVLSSNFLIILESVGPSESVVQAHFKTFVRLRVLRDGSLWPLPDSCCCSLAQLYLTLCSPLACFPVVHCLLECCSNLCPLSRWCHPTILSSVTPFSSCPQSCPVFGVSCLHHVAKVLEIQLQHQFFQWIFRVNFL